MRIVETVRRRQMTFGGHSYRKDDLERAARQERT